MKKINLHFSFLFFTLILSAQTLTLTNGSMEKKLVSSGIYEIYLADSETDFRNDCCNYTDLRGTLTNVTTDSIYMKLNWFAERNMIDDTKIAYSTVSQKGSNYSSFAHSDIFSIRHFKSDKSKKRKQNLSTTGGLLVITGLVTAVNTFLLDNKDGRQILWQSAGVQGGLAIAFIIAGSSKKYQLKGGNPEWKIKK